MRDGAIIPSTTRLAKQSLSGHKMRCQVYRDSRQCPEFDLDKKDRGRTCDEKTLWAIHTIR